MADLVCIAIPARLIKAFSSDGWSEGTAVAANAEISSCDDLSHFETAMAAASLGQSEASLAPRGVTQYVEQQSRVSRSLDRFCACVTRNFAERHGGCVICAFGRCV